MGEAHLLVLLSAHNFWRVEHLNLSHNFKPISKPTPPKTAGGLFV
jgi:hypothetical protein